jgi:acyl-CoA synthetase (AMP-forming)/AMP-acid ligase II
VRTEPTPDALPPSLPRLDLYVARHAERTPDAPALSCGDLRWDYAELHRRIEACAAAMIAAGVAKGDRVATLQTPHPEFVVAFLSTVSIGAIWVGLNPRYRIDEIRHVIDDAAPALLLARARIGSRDFAPELEALAADTPIVLFEDDAGIAGTRTMADFLAAGTSAQSLLADRRAGLCAIDPCLIVYTSGSTGKPKGALLHHRGIGDFSLAQNRLWPVSPYVAVNYFPINHIGCVIDCLMPAIIAGGATCFMETFDPGDCLALMEREGATIWASVPSVFAMQLALPDFARYDLGAVQLVVWEGAAMPADLLPPLIAICPRLATNYGMTETGSAITALAPTDDIDLLAGSVGPAFPDVEIRLDQGEILVRSPFDMIGYWNNPEATAAAFTEDGFFRTGDLGEQRADGRYRLIGRLKEMYKSGGYNVFPREVESVIEAHPAVAQAAVVAASDPIWQEVGIAFVSGTPDLTEAALEQWCRVRLANYKLPKRFILREQLPLLPIGKIDKPALAAEARAMMAD